VAVACLNLLNGFAIALLTGSQRDMRYLGVRLTCAATSKGMHMLPISKSILVAASTLVIGLAAVPTASAVTQDVWFLNAPGDSCQLSLPTIDTVVRPRANGYRNEGTAAKFVICGYGGTRYLQSLVANVQASSLDGAAHSMSCTFTAGTTPGSGLVYVTKTLAVPATGVDYVYVTAEDFGGAAGSTFSNYELSVTCNLPPNVAIVHLENKQRVDVGT
jgi:hypothetical protein